MDGLQLCCTSIFIMARFMSISRCHNLHIVSTVIRRVWLSHRPIGLRYISNMGRKHKTMNVISPAPSIPFGTEQSNVRVIIRVRPFISREKKLNDTKCISINDANNSIIIQNNDKKKEYTYDKILDQSSSQTQVFENGPKQIIQKTLQGYNGCIFCYGQTGSGKTYTMYGDDANPGIIYQSNEYIQNYITNNQTNKTYAIHATFIEIYNEQLQDLLVQDGATKGLLKIREDPTDGVYVEGVIKKEIQSANDLQSIIDFGQKRRTVASTEMNDQSSRSHSILGIHLSINAKDSEVQQTSTLYLVDLAGSERAGSANTSNDAVSNKRLKEGTNINKSLSSLGLVIKSLVDKSKHIPYRNSQLTRLLQDSLGGNSITILIANMSPATSNFPDSLSTLQFANRAKNITNKA
eukprot:596324_1